MEYIVFRFTRAGEPEQWIVPMKEVLECINVNKWEIILPIAISYESPRKLRITYVQQINTLFIGQNNVITPVGSVDDDRYFVFTASLPVAEALDALVEQWSAVDFAKKIGRQQKLANLHRL